MKMHAFRPRFVCAAAVAFAVAAGAGLSALAAETPRIGSPAPPFSLVDEEGKQHSLSDYRGKLVVLEWTNQQCPYVERHYRADTMEKLSREYDSEVVWLAVNSTYSNTPDATRAWKREQGFEYATLQDADGTVGHLYGARTTPNMYVIDAKGVLRYAGAIDDDPRGKTATPQNHVSAAIQAVLAGTDPDPTETRPYGCSVKYR